MGKNLLETRSRFAQLLLRDVDRDINGRFFERFNESPRLGACASSKSDELNVRSKFARRFRHDVDSRISISVRVM